MESALLNKLSAWFKKFKRYKVGYRNGSFQLSSLNNSPFTVIESFDKMPFCRHDRANKLLSADTLFFKASLYYCKPEEDLWVFVSSLNFKQNVMMINLYEKEIPVEYHFVNLHFKSKSIVNKSTVNGLVLSDRIWSMFKAGHATTEYHFKNSNERNITIYFTSKWLERQKENNPLFKKSKLAEFFESKNTYLLLHEEDNSYEQIYEKMLRLGDEDSGEKWNKGIKKYAFQILENFINKLNSEIISDNHFKLTDKDRKNVQEIEKYLNDKLFGNFPGIEKISKRIGVSPTKIKNDFKSIHNKALFQYFSALQMEAAYQLLSQKKHSVKEVANLFGYENASKFSTVFKKSFDCAPSELIKTEIRDLK